MDSIQIKQQLEKADNLCIKIGETKKYYVITNKDNIFYLEEADTVAANSTASYEEITNLNLPHLNPPHLYQIYKIWIDGHKTYTYTNLFFTNSLSIQLKNIQPIEINPKIWYIGWRYAIEELPSKPDQFTQITTGIAQSRRKRKMECENCHKEIKKDSKFCSYCGKELKESDWEGITEQLKIQIANNKKNLLLQESRLKEAESHIKEEK